MTLFWTVSPYYVGCIFLLLILSGDAIHHSNVIHSRLRNNGKYFASSDKTSSNPSTRIRKENKPQTLKHTAKHPGQTHHHHLPHTRHEFVLAELQSTVKSRCDKSGCDTNQKEADLEQIGPDSKVYRVTGISKEDCSLHRPQSLPGDNSGNVPEDKSTEELSVPPSANPNCRNDLTIFGYSKSDANGHSTEELVDGDVQSKPKGKNGDADTFWKIKLDFGYVVPNIQTVRLWSNKYAADGKAIPATVKITQNAEQNPLKYLGCYKSSGHHAVDTYDTPQKCADARPHTDRYIGMEYGGECWFDHSKLSELVKEENKISEKDCSTYDKTSKHPLGGDNAIAVYERSSPHISGCSAGNKAFAIWQHSNRPKKDNNDIKFSDWIVNTKGKKDAYCAGRFLTIECNVADEQCLSLSEIEVMAFDGAPRFHGKGLLIKGKEQNEPNAWTNMAKWSTVSYMDNDKEEPPTLESQDAKVDEIKTPVLDKNIPIGLDRLKDGLLSGRQEDGGLWIAPVDGTKAGLSSRNPNIRKAPDIIFDLQVQTQIGRIYFFGQTLSNELKEGKSHTNGWLVDSDPKKANMNPITVELYLSDPRIDKEATPVKTLSNVIAPQKGSYQQIWFRNEISGTEKNPFPIARYVKISNLHSKHEISSNEIIGLLGMAEIQIMAPNDHHFEIKDPVNKIKFANSEKESKRERNRKAVFKHQIPIGEFLSHPARSKHWFNKYELRYRHAFNIALRGDANVPTFKVGDKVRWTQSNSDIPTGTVGIYKRPCNGDQIGKLYVEFPKGSWCFDKSKLYYAGFNVGDYVTKLEVVDANQFRNTAIGRISKKEGELYEVTFKDVVAHSHSQIQNFEVGTKVQCRSSWMKGWADGKVTKVNEDYSKTKAYQLTKDSKIYGQGLSVILNDSKKNRVLGNNFDFKTHYRFEECRMKKTWVYSKQKSHQLKPALSPEAMRMRAFYLAKTYKTWNTENSPAPFYGFAYPDWVNDDPSHQDLKKNNKDYQDAEAEADENEMLERHDQLMEKVRFKTLSSMHPKMKFDGEPLLEPNTVEHGKRVGRYLAECLDRFVFETPSFTVELSALKDHAMQKRHMFEWLPKEERSQAQKKRWESYLAARFIANGLNTNSPEYGTCVNASGEDRPCVMDKVKLQTHLVDIIDKLIAENEDQEVTEEPLGKKTEENEELAELKKIHDEIKAAADDTVLQKIVDKIEGSTKLLADKIEENKKKAEIAISNRRINPESGAMTGIAASMGMMGISSAAVGSTQHVIHMCSAGATEAVTSLEAAGTVLAGIGVIFTAISFANTIAEGTANEIAVEGFKLALSVASLGVTIALAVTVGAAHAALAAVGAVIGVVSSAFQAGFALYKAHACFADGSPEETARGIVLVTAAAAFIGSVVFSIMVMAAGACATGVGVFIGIGLALLGGLLLFISSLMPTAPVLDAPNCCDDVFLIEHAISLGYLYPKVWFSMHDTMQTDDYESIRKDGKKSDCMPRSIEPTYLLQPKEAGCDNCVGAAGASLCLGSWTLKKVLRKIFSPKSTFFANAGRSRSTHHTTSYWVMDAEIDYRKRKPDEDAPPVKVINWDIDMKDPYENHDKNNYEHFGCKKNTCWSYCGNAWESSSWCYKGGEGFFQTLASTVVDAKKRPMGTKNGDAYCESWKDCEFYMPCRSLCVWGGQAYAPELQHYGSWQTNVPLKKNN